MRKVFLGLLLAGLTGFIFSCQKENVLTQANELASEFALATDVTALGVEELPASISRYVSNNQQPLEIEVAYHSHALGYQVILENGQDLYFNSRGDCTAKGGGGHGGHGGGHGDGDHGDGDNHGDGHGDGGSNRCLFGDSLVVSDLPQAALDYVAANYADLTITAAVVKPSGKFGVELSDGTVLLFDADGNFVEECTGHVDVDGHGDGHGGNHGGPTRSCLRGDTSSVDSLPQAALDYLAANNAADTVAVVIAKPNGWFAVGLTNGSVLIFDADGAYVRDCEDRPGHGGPVHGGTDIAPDQLPQAILDYLAANHADATIERAVLTFSGKYFIRLSDGTKLIFDENGNVLFDSGD